MMPNRKRKLLESPCKENTCPVGDRQESKKKTKKYNHPKGQSQSCHQCRQSIFSSKGVGEIKLGQKRIKCSSCTRYWCENCLMNRYGLDRSDLPVDSWECPVCNGSCNCSVCRRKNGKLATGILTPVVKNAGFSNVNEFLEKGTDDIAKCLQWRSPEIDSTRSYSNPASVEKRKVRKPPKRQKVKNTSSKGVVSDFENEEVLLQHPKYSITVQETNEIIDSDITKVNADGRNNRVNGDTKKNGVSLRGGTRKKNEVSLRDGTTRENGGRRLSLRNRKPVNYFPSEYECIGEENICMGNTKICPGKKIVNSAEDLLCDPKENGPSLRIRKPVDNFSSEYECNSDENICTGNMKTGLGKNIVKMFDNDNDPVGGTRSSDSTISECSQADYREETEHETMLKLLRLKALKEIQVERVKVKQEELIIKRCKMRQEKKLQLEKMIAAKKKVKMEEQRIRKEVLEKKLEEKESKRLLQEKLKKAKQLVMEARKDKKMRIEKTLKDITSSVNTKQLLDQSLLVDDSPVECEEMGVAMLPTLASFQVDIADWCVSKLIFVCEFLYSFASELNLDKFKEKLLSCLLERAYFVNKLYASLLGLIAEHDEMFKTTLEQWNGSQRTVRKFVCDYIRRQSMTNDTVNEYDNCIEQSIVILEHLCYLVLQNSSLVEGHIDSIESQIKHARSTESELIKEMREELNNVCHNDGTDEQIDHIRNKFDDKIKSHRQQQQFRRDFGIRCHYLGSDRYDRVYWKLRSFPGIMIECVNKEGIGLWSVIDSKEMLEEYIDCLNTRGFRESVLYKNLQSIRSTLL